MNQTLLDIWNLLNQNGFILTTNLLKFLSVIENLDFGIENPNKENFLI